MQQALVQHRPVTRWIKNSSVLCATMASWTSLRLLKQWQRRIRNNTVLELDLRAGTFVEEMDPISRELYKKEYIHLRSVVEMLETAAADRRVKGLVVLLDSGVNINLGAVAEVWDAIRAFSEQKPSVAYAETFLESGNPLVIYTLATACREVYMPGYAGIGLTGVRVKSAFIRQLLEKCGVEPHLLQRREYKSMANFFNEEKFTPEHKEMMTEMTESLITAIYSRIGRGRNLDATAVRSIIEDGPILTHQECLEQKLVDGFSHRDAFFETTVPTLMGVAKQRMNLLYSSIYLARVKRTWFRKGKETIALINAEGTIHRGKSKTLFESGPSIGSTTLSMALRDARKDKKVKAIVLRINSGGGSAVASDIIHEEVLQAKADGKKVIVSMGSLAASGGYFIAAPADRILAQPETLTGSIGVVFGKFNLRGLWNKLGVTFDEVEGPESADIWSTIDGYSEENRKRMEALTDVMYEDFKAKVAAGRSLTPDAVEEVARGRVWTGTQALERGLVDSLGGLREALDVAKREIGVPLDRPVKIKNYPLQLPLIATLIKRKPKSHSEESSPDGAALGSGMLNTLKMWRNAVQLFGLILSGVPASQWSMVQQLAAHPNEPLMLASTPNLG